MNGSEKHMFAAVFVIALMSVSSVLLITASDESDAAPRATYDLNAQVGTYYEFDTDIPSNYAVGGRNHSIGSALPAGMSLNAGGDIAGSPLMPGHYDLTYYPGGDGSAANVYAGNYIEVYLNVSGEPSPEIAAAISGSATVTVNKNTVSHGSYNPAAQYFRASHDNIPFYFGDSAIAAVDDMAIYGDALCITDWDYEGEIAIKPTILNFTNVTHTESTTLFTNLSYGNGTFSFEFNPAAHGIYAVGLYIRADGPGYGGGYESFVCTNVFCYGTPFGQIAIVSSPADSVTAGSVWSYTPHVSVSGASISVSGAPWLSVSGGTISGTAPLISVPQMFGITVTASETGYVSAAQTFGITVYPGQIAINSVPVDEAAAGSVWSYTPQIDTLGAALSVTGAPWLSVNGWTISGLAPAPSGGTSQTWPVTITVSKEGYVSATQDVTITVNASAVSPTLPTASLTVTPAGGTSFAFDASGSSGFDTISLDYGDGNIAAGALTSTHTYAPGVYNAVLTATNPNGSPTSSVTVIAATGDTNTYAYFAQPYTYVIAAAGDGVPVLSGTDWLSISDHGNGYIVVSGTPSSSEYVDNVYVMTVTIGSRTIEWNVTVEGGPEYPVPGFIVRTEGMKVTITPSAVNADAIEYNMGDGHVISDTGAVTYTYSAPGSYTIEQIVSSTVSGVPVTLTFPRSVIAASPDTGDGDPPGDDPHGNDDSELPGGDPPGDDDKDPSAGDNGGSGDGIEDMIGDMIGNDTLKYAAIVLSVIGLAAAIFLASRGMTIFGALIGIVSIAALAILTGWPLWK